MRKSKQLALSGLCLAMAIALPLAFHSIPGAGAIILPMHLPVLLCGLLCSWPYAMACGLLAPLLSSLFTGMPPAALLPGMIIELAVYGLVASLLTHAIKTKSPYANALLALVGAMLCGRVVLGLVNALVLQAGAYSLQIWLAASFVKGFIGIAAQLALLPALVALLKKSRLLQS